HGGSLLHLRATKKPEQEELPATACAPSLHGRTVRPRPSRGPGHPLLGGSLTPHNWPARACSGLPMARSAASALSSGAQEARGAPAIPRDSPAKRAWGGGSAACVPLPLRAPDRARRRAAP